MNSIPKRATKSNKQGQPKTLAYAARFPPALTYRIRLHLRGGCLELSLFAFTEGGEKMAEQGAPFAVMSDTYHVWVPIEDSDLLKSIEVDANGDYIVQGVMTSDVKDEEDDSIDPDGMDCSYFLQKGWVKYEHGNNPNQFIGEPLEVKVGQFKHPTLDKSVNGIFVKARLFAQRELTKQAVRAMEDLAKSHTKRRMGWSIEGNVKERCRKTGKIIKSVLRNVVLTMNPVNTITWAELAKSFAKNHELTINMEPMDKSMDTTGMAQIMPQSLEGSDPEEDEQERWLKSFRAFCKANFLQKSARATFVHSSPEQIRDDAFDFAVMDGLAYEGATAFASYIAGKHGVLKSICKALSNGGEKMTQEELENMAKVLDTDVEELRKSLEADELDEEEEALNKSMGDGDGDEDDSSEGDGDGDDDDSSDGDGDEDDDDDDSEGTNKSFHSDLSKSLANTHEQAFEVSGFLQDMTDEIGLELQGMQKSLSAVLKQNNALVKSMLNQNDLMKAMVSELAATKQENAELQKSMAELQGVFGELLNRPVGRKGVTSQREMQTLNKSMQGGNTGGGKKALTRGQAMDILEKSLEAGNAGIGREIIRYNAGVPLDQLKLTPELRQELGLD